MFLMRLSLLVPFNVSNYIFGGSAVKLKDYLIGTIGVLPIALFFVYIGTTMSNIYDALSSGKEKITTLQIVVMVVGSLLSLSGIVYVSLVVRR